MAVRLTTEGRRIAEVECVDRVTRQPRRFAGRIVVVAGGALATPHLLLASGLESMNPAGDAVGRYLMRHCNAILMGWFARKPAPRDEFHKHIGIHDFYFGHPSVVFARGKLGCLQQFGTPQPDYVLGLAGVDRASHRGAAERRAHGRAEGAARHRRAHQRDDRDRGGQAQPGESRPSAPAAEPVRDADRDDYASIRCARHRRPRRAGRRRPPHPPRGGRDGDVSVQHPDVLPRGRHGQAGRRSVAIAPRRAGPIAASTTCSSPTAARCRAPAA